MEDAQIQSTQYKKWNRVNVWHVDYLVYIPVVVATNRKH